MDSLTQIVTPIICLVTFCLSLYIINLIQKGKTDSQGISREILVGLLKELQDVQNQLHQALMENNSKLSNNLERNISELRIKILENLTQTSHQTQSHIQDKLDKASLNLLETTRIELSKISSSTKERLESINEQVQKRLDENFARNVRSFEQVSKNLGAMEQKAQSMIEATKSIDKLNNIFSRQSSKGFGGFAEDYLESMLRKYLLANSWQKQVRVPGSSEMIDFVIQLDDKIIGIDSKFPLTKYQDYLSADTDQEKKLRKNEFLRAIVDMAKGISSKYYQNNFLDTLLLYLPSDSMLIECMEHQELLDKIHDFKVTIVSPHTLFSQLVIIQSYQLKAQVAGQAEEIIHGLKEVHRNIQAFREEYKKLGEKLRQAQTNYMQAEKSLTGVERNILLLEGK